MFFATVDCASDSEHEQLAVDARRAPKRVGYAHQSNEVTNPAIKWWLSRAGATFPPPVRAKPRRCQRITVSGLMILIALRIGARSRYSQTNGSRSEFARRTRFASLRIRTLIC
jgi:hypothetical protein